MGDWTLERHPFSLGNYLDNIWPVDCRGKSLNRHTAVLSKRSAGWSEALSGKGLRSLKVGGDTRREDVAFWADVFHFLARVWDI